MRAQDLPFEICLQIFQQINKSKAHVCMTVCKSWHQAAVQAYYEEVALSGKEKLLYLKEKLQLDDSQQDQQFSNCKSTKKLKIEKEHKSRNDPVISFKKPRFMEEDEAANAKLDTKEFIKLLSYMPNLKILDFSNSKNYSAYMELLRDGVDAELLKYIEEIPKGADNWYVRDDSLYFAVCYKFRQTITRLALQHIKTIYSLDGISGTCLYFLPSFVNLTDLTIHNDYENLTLFDLLETCPNLINLEYVSYYMEVVDDGSDNMDIRTTAAAPRYYSKHLKTLNLQLPSLAEPYLSYLTNYPTGTLNTLNVSMIEAEFYEWIYGNGVEAIMDFGRRLSLIKDIRIYTNPDDVERDVEMDQSKINVFFQFLNAVQGDRNLYCRGVFTELKSDEIDIRVSNDTYMSFQYGLDSGDYSFDADEDEVASTLPVLDKQITKLGLEMINCLEFAFLKRVNGIPLDALEYGFNNCPHLESFHVNCINSRLKFEAGKSTRYNSNNKRSNELITQHELDKVKVEGDGLTQNLIDILSKYLPDLKTLISLAVFSYDCDMDHLLNININLSEFKNLNGFYYDISKILYSRFNHKFLQLDFAGKGVKSIYELHETQSTTEGENTKYGTKLTPTTADYVAECQQDKSLCTSVIKLECNSVKEVVFLRSYASIAEFYNGRYEKISTAPFSIVEELLGW